MAKTKECESCKPFDTVGFIMGWEDGSIEQGSDAEAEGFQKLIDQNIVWQLQGCYGRRAEQLIRSGKCLAR